MCGGKFHSDFTHAQSSCFKISPIIISQSQGEASTIAGWVKVHVLQAWHTGFCPCNSRKGERLSFDFDLVAFPCKHTVQQLLKQCDINLYNLRL